MTAAAARFWQSGERWRDIARASRYLSQILIPASVIFILFSQADPPTMAAFLLATIVYGVLAWKFPSIVFAYGALGASVGTVLFGLRVFETSPQWYATVGAILALAYILISQFVKRTKADENIIESYVKAFNTTGFILIGLAAIDGLILTFNTTTFWAGVIALGISSLDLAICAYLFKHSRYTFLASGLAIVPFTLAIGRWLNDAQTIQALTWVTVAWGALALTYIALAALLQKADTHARWLYAWAHVLIPLALFFTFFDYLSTEIHRLLFHWESVFQDTWSLSFYKTAENTHRFLPYQPGFLLAWARASSSGLLDFYCPYSQPSHGMELNFRAHGLEPLSQVSP